MRERICGTLRRVVGLPADMTRGEAKASFKNGVLEVRLKRQAVAPSSRIEIE